MSTCRHCKKEIPQTDRRLKFEGSIDWTVAMPEHVDAAERALAGSAEFCSIRCLGTFIGVTLQSRGLIPTKPE